MNAAPYENLTASEYATYLEVPGLLKVQHRLGCAQADTAASDNSIGLRVHEMAVIPPGYNTGTVFLNGWRLAYQDGDHHVRGLGSAIFNITQTQNADRNALHWEAGGVLADDGIVAGIGVDHPYAWCGIYTLVFWHRNLLDYTLIPPQVAALPSHTDAPPTALTFVHSEGFDPGNNTARRELPGFSYTSPGPQHAVLPRAFGFVWGSSTDHHQLGDAGDWGGMVAVCSPPQTGYAGTHPGSSASYRQEPCPGAGQPAPAWTALPAWLPSHRPLQGPGGLYLLLSGDFPL